MTSKNYSLPCRVLVCFLACLVLFWAVMQPLAVSATAPAATVVGVSALCVVGAALIGLGVKPLVESSIDSFENLVSEIVSAMPSDLLVSTYQSSKSTKMIQYGGVSYIPRAVIEYVLNFVVANAVSMGFALSSVAIQTISEYLAANNANYERAQECRYLYHIACPDSSILTEAWIWSNDTVELVRNFQNGRYLYYYKCYGPSYVTTKSKLDDLLTLDWCDINVYDETMSYPRTVSLGVSSVDSGTIEVQEKEYTATVDGLALTDSFDTSLASEDYDFWTQNGLTVADTASLPLSVPASIPDAVTKTQTEVVAGTATKAETAVIEDAIAGTDTGTATLGFLDSILSWLEMIWNAIKALIGGITAPIVNSLSEVVAAVKSVAVSITDFLTLKFQDANFYAIDLSKFFPFCIPFDLYDMLAAFVAEPEAPVFTFSTGFLGNVYSVDIDLSPWDGVAQTVRTIQLCICIVGLAFATRKFIKW